MVHSSGQQRVTSEQLVLGFRHVNNFFSSNLKMKATVCSATTHGGLSDDTDVEALRKMEILVARSKTVSKSW